MNLLQEKKLRKMFRKEILSERFKVEREEESARVYARSLIKEILLQKEWNIINEGKDTAKPHPSTAINFLRDAFRKLMPNLERDYKLLTSSKEQRESFKNHYLAAVMRMFDQADAMAAEVDIEDYNDGTEGQESAEPAVSDLTAPSDADIENLEKDLGIQMENLLSEIEIIDEQEEEETTKIKKGDIDVVSDTKPKKEKSKGLESDIEKEISKKKEIDKDRELFGAGIEGDVTGRNKSYDSFKNTKNYILNNYQDLSNQKDKEDYKKWAVYNMKLAFDGFEKDLEPTPATPEIPEPIA